MYYHRDGLKKNLHLFWYLLLFTDPLCSSLVLAAWPCLPNSQKKGGNMLSFWQAKNVTKTKAWKSGNITIRAHIEHLFLTQICFSRAPGKVEKSLVTFLLISFFVCLSSLLSQTILFSARVLHYFQYLVGFYNWMLFL